MLGLRAPVAITAVAAIRSRNSIPAYTNYAANPDTPVDPCQSCYGGAGTDAQNLTKYEYGAPQPCGSCVTGEAGK